MSIIDANAGRWLQQRSERSSTMQISPNWILKCDWLFAKFEQQWKLLDTPIIGLGPSRFVYDDEFMNESMISLWKSL